MRDDDALASLWVCRGKDVVTESGEPVASCLRKEDAATIVWLHNSEVRRVRGIKEREEAERKAWDKLF